MDCLCARRLSGNCPGDLGRAQISWPFPPRAEADWEAIVSTDLILVKSDAIFFKSQIRQLPHGGPYVRRAAAGSLHTTKRYFLHKGQRLSQKRKAPWPYPFHTFARRRVSALGRTGFRDGFWFREPEASLLPTLAGAGTHGAYVYPAAALQKTVMHQRRGAAV